MAYNDSLVNKLPATLDGFTPSFRQLIYSHLTYLRTRYINNLLNVAPFDAHRHRGNLFGLLRGQGLSNKMAWVVGVVNGIDDPTLYDGSLTSFILPAQEEILLLERRHKSIDSEVK